jgi:C4-dicarboxylate-specific signal transduction histidine kinase
VRARGRPTKGADGRIAQIAGTVADITEQMNLKAEVERQRQSLAHLTRVGVIGELSGALAHELNQPLTAILSNAQAVQRMIGRNPIDLGELRSAITDIIDDDGRAGDVIRHLRTLLKKDDGHREVLDVNDLVAKALALTKSDLTARHITVVSRFSERPLKVVGDAVQLQQLFLNLIMNAADAMGEQARPGGVLMAVTDLVGGEFVHVSVSDTGSGIPASIMEKLFEPFFSTKKQGLGLGLSISRAIVTSHGGTIWAENNVGHGATLHVSIPRTREAAA